MISSAPPASMFTVEFTIYPCVFLLLLFVRVCMRLCYFLPGNMYTIYKQQPPQQQAPQQGGMLGGHPPPSQMQQGMYGGEMPRAPYHTNEQHPYPPPAHGQSHPGYVRRILVSDKQGHYIYVWAHESFFFFFFFSNIHKV